MIPAAAASLTPVAAHSDMLVLLQATALATILRQLGVTVYPALVYLFSVL